MSGSEWALRDRRLSAEASSAKGGRFSFDLAPWQRKVLDQPERPDVREVVLMWASQVTGKTETVTNMVGRKIAVDPLPIMVVQPTLVLAETWSKDRLTTMLRDTPKLRGKVKDARRRDADNKILHKRFPGGHVTIAGANSAASLASRPIGFLLLDEIDRYPETCGDEGDPIALAAKRIESFPDAVVVKISTPLIRGTSNIEKAFDESDKNYWFVPCHSCGHRQHLKWGQVRWQKDDPTTARYHCENCDEPWNDAQRREAILKGEWVATADFHGISGFHINGIYCLFRHHKGFRDRLHQMVCDFLAAKRRGRHALKVWTNTFLAETWNETIEELNPDPLLSRRETYGPDLPPGVIILTAAVDTHGNRLVLDVEGWGTAQENWGIEMRTFFGSPHLPKVWQDLDEFLNRSFRHPSGARLRIQIIGVDSGGVDNKNSAFSVPVYAFIRKHQQASRGQAGYIALKGSSIRNAALWTERLQRNGINLMMIGTDTAKRTVYDRLRIQEVGPRYMHFPCEFERGKEKVDAGYNEEYFKQLTAEVVTLGGEWKKKYERNEGLDLKAYNLALFDLLNPDLPKLSSQLQIKRPELPPAIPQPVGQVQRLARRPRGFARKW